MPIRPSITAADTNELDTYDRKRREPKKPSAPKKPTRAERQEFVRSLHAVPVGKTYDRREYSKKVTEAYIFKKFEVWGFELCIMPLHMTLPEDLVTCTGASVMRTKVNSRGVKPRCKLHGEQRTWYGQIINWISETEYE